MLGQMVVRVLEASDVLDVSYTARGNDQVSFIFNVENGIGELRRIVEDNGRFDYFINCIGVLKRDIDERDQASIRRADMVNALFPRDLSDLARETQARVIQISTDAVFGKDPGICFEDSVTEPEDIYGQTKIRGEVLAPWFLNLRCSIIGPDAVNKRGLFEWFIGQPKNAQVMGYKDHIWNGVTTLQFAGLCNDLIIKGLFDNVCGESTTYHFCPNKELSKFDLLLLFKKIFRPDIKVVPITSDSGPVTRILKTRYDSLKNLFGYEKPMENAINELFKQEKTWQKRN